MTLGGVSLARPPAGRPVPEGADKDQNGPPSGPGPTSDVPRPRPTLRVVATYEPAELARELGYTNEHRPEKVVRDYLRKKYPDHPKHQRWVLDEVQAADVRVNVPRKR